MFLQKIIWRMQIIWMDALRSSWKTENRKRNLDKTHRGIRILQQIGDIFCTKFNEKKKFCQDSGWHFHITWFPNFLHWPKPSVPSKRKNVDAWHLHETSGWSLFIARPIALRIKISIRTCGENDYWNCTLRYHLMENLTCRAAYQIPLQFLNGMEKNHKDSVLLISITP